MRIVVVGAGAIGTFYAARLSALNHVTLVARRQGDVDVIRSRGVRITGIEESNSTVGASTGIDRLDPDALVVLATKAYDNEAVARALVPLLRADTTILCLQNGLQSDRIVRDAVGGRCHVLRGITDFGVIFGRPGEVSLRARGPTVIEAGTRSAELAHAFARAGLEGRVSDDIRHEVWRKLVVNCVINPLTAIAGTEVGWIAAERLDPLKQRIVDECAAVARLEGVTFDAAIVASLNERYGPSRNQSSMSQDLARGRRTEIDYMNGAVVDLALRHGIACPVNAALTAIIRAMEPR